MPARLKYLIINADDFGYCPRRNQAIIDLFNQQAISSASLLVNGDYAQDACALAHASRLPMGIHLNLTEGRPISPDLARIRSLVDADGFMHGKIGLRDQLAQGAIHGEHIDYELEMQLQRFLELTGGQTPRHIDGHQHIHVHPMIVNSIARLANQFGIKYIRLPDDQMLRSSGTDNPFYQSVLDQCSSAGDVFDRHILIYPQCFFGMGMEFTPEIIERCLKLLEKTDSPPVVAELMCHPGYPSEPHRGGCGTGHPDSFSQSIERQNEFNVLSSATVKKLFDQYRVQLCDYDAMPVKSERLSRDRLDDGGVSVDASPGE